MNIPLFIGIVALLGGIYIWIGQSASKGLQSNDDYFLMGRKLTFLPLCLTLLATQLGGGTLLGAAQEAYLNGWLVLLYPLGACLGLIALGLGFGKKLRALNLTTVAQLFETVYGSHLQRRIAGLLSVVSMFAILVAQGIAARLFFAALGFEHPALFVTFWTVLVTYTVMGGLKAVVNTDILQVVFIVATLILAILSVNTDGLVAVISPVETGLSQIPWSGWLLMPLLFMLVEQDMGQRCFAAKNGRVIATSAITAGIALLASSAVAIYFGVLARNLGVTVSGNASILLETMKLVTNPAVTTLFMVGIFLAIISTADSLLCAISSNLAYDFLSSRNISAARQVRLSQWLTLATGLSALAFAYLFDNIVSVLMLSYELIIDTLFIPVAVAILLPRPCKMGAYGAMGMGALGFITFRVCSLGIPTEVLSLLMSGGGYLVGATVARGRQEVQI